MSKAKGGGIVTTLAPVSSASDGIGVSDSTDGEFSGWMLKAAPKMVDVDKQDSVARRLRRVANHLLRSVRHNADFKRRYFVLDGTELRYYRDDTLQRFQGSVDLSTVLEVQYADRAGLPPFAIDLVTDARTFTVAPSPASETAAREWLMRLTAKIESGKKRGMLAKSLRGVAAKRHSISGGSSGVDGGALGGSVSGGIGGVGGSGNGNGAGGGVDALILPLYLSHEQCRLAPQAISTASINISLAGGGGAASSSLVWLRTDAPPGAGAGVDTATIGAVNALAVQAAGGTALQGSGIDLPTAGGNIGTGVIDLSARRGSAAYALPDFAAPLPLVVDPMRRDRPAAVLARTGNNFGAAAGMMSPGARPQSLPSSAFADGTPGALDVAAAGKYGSVVTSAPLRRRGLGLGLGAGPVGGGMLGFAWPAAQREQTRHKRRAREISRWEELSGNAPRWTVSFVNDHRVKHLPIFAPVLALGPGQEGFISNAIAAPGDGEGEDGGGKKGKKSKKGKKGKKDKKKKAAKKEKKKKQMEEKLKKKNKKDGAASEGGGGGDDDDADDEEEEEEEEEDEDDEQAQDAIRPLSASASTPRGGGGGGEADDDGVEKPSSASLVADSKVPLIKRQMKELRGRVAAMKSSSASRGEGGAIASSGSSSSATKRGSGSEAKETDQEARQAALNTLAGTLPGARGNEMDLIVALSSRERAHLAYVRMTQREQDKLGWSCSIGFADVPLPELLKDKPEGSRAGVAGGGNRAAAAAASQVPSTAARMAMAHGVPPPLVHLLSDTSAIANFAASIAQRSNIIAGGNKTGAAVSAAAQLAAPTSASRSVSLVNSGAGGTMPAGASNNTSTSGSGINSAARMLSASNRPSYQKMQNLRAERIAAIHAQHEATHRPGSQAAGIPAHAHPSTLELPPLHALSTGQAAAVKALAEDSADDEAVAVLVTSAAATSEPIEGGPPSVSSTWTAGGRALFVSDYPPPALLTGTPVPGTRILGIDGFETSLVCPPTGSGKRPVAGLADPSHSSSSAAAASYPTLARIGAMCSQWSTGAPAPLRVVTSFLNAAAGASSDPFGFEAPPPPSLTLALSGQNSGMANRIAEMRLTSRKRDNFVPSPAYGFDLWSVATSRQTPECHGSMYGLPGVGFVNEWEDPRRTLGLPNSIDVSSAVHAGLFGPLAPSTLRPLLSLDPYGDPDSHSGDNYETALSYFRFHKVPTETVLLRAQSPFGVPTRGGMGSRPLFGDPQSLYILLHGRVRIHTKHVGENRGAGRAAWAKLRRILLVQSMFRKGTLMAQLDKAARNAKLEAEARDAEIAAESRRDMPSLGMAVGATAGDSNLNAGMWVEMNAIANPIILGAHSIVHGFPHWSTVATVEPSIVLELKPAQYTRLCRALPSVGAGLRNLASLFEPHRIVACVPSLVAALADSSPRGPAGLDHHVLVSSIAALFRPVVLSVGEALFSEGDPGDAAYVVVSGQIAITVNNPSTTAPAPALLAVYTRGSCVGESALVQPGPRACKAVALTSSVVLRISGVSLRMLLWRRQKVWRIVRNAVLQRDQSQLCRLPVLAFLAGGEEEAARLAPLTDLFRAVVVADTGDRSTSAIGLGLGFGSMPAPPPAPTASSSSASSISNAGSSGAVSQPPGERLAVPPVAHVGGVPPSRASSQPWDVDHWAVNKVEGNDMKALIVCSYGNIEVRGAASSSASSHSLNSSGSSSASSQVVSAGEWVGGSSLYTTSHLSEHASISLPPAHFTGSVATGAGGPSQSPPVAVLLTLHHRHLDALIAAIPGGPQRLQMWRGSGGGNAGLLARLKSTPASPSHGSRNSESGNESGNESSGGGERTGRGSSSKGGKKAKAAEGKGVASTSTNPMQKK